MRTEITDTFLDAQGFSRTFPDRFWDKVEKTDGCWIWIGPRLKSGYGSIFTSRHHGSRFCELAHRASWILHNLKPIPKGMYICHSCDNPPCVRPDHLWLGTPARNNADMAIKGRALGGLRKVTASDVLSIRKLYGTMPRDALGQQFGISGAQAWHIATFRSWKNIN